MGLVSIVLRFPSPDTQNYICADATWHSLLTMQAYSETPSETHKFLPIVTLGSTDDKDIPWGATIPDQYGNYYYTSFGAFGYFVPYIFVRSFNLPISEQSLYIFNSALYLLCFSLTVVLMLKLFDEKLPKWLIIIISTLYLFQPEILHSQGIVYWYQSLFQFVFLLQLILFINLQGKWRYIAFFLLCLVAPYLEWTGYVSNVGFAVALFMKSGVSANKEYVQLCTEKLIKSVVVLVLTILSFALFVVHYLTVVEKTTFYNALVKRFGARSFSAGGATLKALATGYMSSFGILIIITAIVLVIALFISATRTALRNEFSDQHIVLFVTVFALLENLIMRQHAIAYTFDRMKAVFPLLIILVLCISAVYTVLKKPIYRQVLTCIICVAVFIVSGISLKNYVTDNNHFKWDAPYLQTNRAIAEQLISEYTPENSIYVQEKAVRGYTNLLFGRGVYENVTLEKAIPIAQTQSKRYIVELNITGGAWNMYEYSDYTVLDLQSLDDTVLNITDGNWEKGVKIAGNVLLFANTPQYKEKLIANNPQTISVKDGGAVYTEKIVSVKEYGSYIWLTLEDNADKWKFQYPKALFCE
jgi:hypothetical protein